MKNRFSISVLILFLTVIFSCKKDEQQTTTTPERVNSMSAFNAAHKKPTQQFTLDAGSGGSIITSGGIEFSFPSNAFVNSSGTIVTGNIDVKIDEIITKADLFLNNISTHADGRPLKSGGAYKIKIIQGSGELSIAPGKLYHVWLTSDYSEPTMETYYGYNSTDQYGKINWNTTPPGMGPNVFTYTTDSVNIYELLVTELDWINCDHPYDSIFGELNISLPDGADNSQVMVFDNTAMFGINLWENNSSAHWSYAPLNKTLSVVVLKDNNGIFKVSAQSFTFTGQAITMPSFVTITESDLVTLLNSF